MVYNLSEVCDDAGAVDWGNSLLAERTLPRAALVWSPARMTTDTTFVAMLFCTQLVLTLYGAGIRRPFGSLQTIQELPPRLRRARLPTLIADLLFVAFVLFMWWFLILRMDFLQFVVLAVTFAVIGEYLTHRIRLMPSFLFSLLLAAACLLLVWQFEVHGATVLTIK